MSTSSSEDETSDFPFPHVSDEILNDPNYSRKTVQIDKDRRLSYSQCGNLESDHVVLFHIGLMGSSLVTSLVHQQALEFNIRLIVLDYPGIGESTLVQNWTPQDWASSVEDFCREALPKDQKIMLLGHCLGVAYVMAVWARMMDRVSSMTLVSPWVGDAQTNPWWMRYFVSSLPMQGYVPSVGAPLLGLSTYFNRPLSYLVGGEMRKLLRAVNEMQTYNLHQGSAGNREMIRMALESSSKEEFWEPILKEILAKYQDQGSEAISIRVYHGTADAMVTQEACQLLIGWLEEVKCKVDFSVLDKADHNTILIDPKNMATLLEPFGKKRNDDLAKEGN